jgi:hypothetical protein
MRWKTASTMRRSDVARGRETSRANGRLVLPSIKGSHGDRTEDAHRHTLSLDGFARSTYESIRNPLSLRQARMAHAWLLRITRSCGRAPNEPGTGYSTACCGVADRYSPGGLHEPFLLSGLDDVALRLFSGRRGPRRRRSGAADQERGRTFGDHHRSQVRVRARNRRHDGSVDDREALHADETALRIDDGRGIVG